MKKGSENEVVPEYELDNTPVRTDSQQEGLLYEYHNPTAMPKAVEQNLCHRVRPERTRKVALCEA